MSLGTRATSPTDLRGKRVVVMGLGQFGGGIGVAKFLHTQGARILITDQSPIEKLQGSLAKIADLQVDLRLGEHRIEDFTTADLIVVSPAVKPANNIYLAAATGAGVPLTSEIRLLTQRLPNRARTIGITGSAGKSTTTAMVGQVMNQFQVPGSKFQVGEGSSLSSGSSSPTWNVEPGTWNPSCFLGGNLGGSLLGNLDEIRADDWVVLELSSFMLEGLREDGWSPHIALITNLAPNHLDWHDTLDGYRAAKQVLFDFQKPGDVAILGPGADGFAPRVSPQNVRDFHDADIAALTKDIPPLLIPGAHNRINAAMAAQVCIAAGIGHDHIFAALATFPGLEHRLQFVADHNGVRYFNDSKCTTPEAAMLALKSFKPDLVHVILGGYDKGSDLSALAVFAKSHCRAICTIGVTGDAVASAAESATGDAQVIRSTTLTAAMKHIQSQAATGEVVLLSPACASWDQFTNFEARGQMFVELVQAVTAT